MPALAPAAEHSLAHSAGRLIEQARRLMPHAETAVLPGTSHHAPPMGHADETGRRLPELPG